MTDAAKPDPDRYVTTSAEGILRCIEFMGVGGGTMTSCEMDCRPAGPWPADPRPAAQCRGTAQCRLGRHFDRARDGQPVWVYTAFYCGLPSFEGPWYGALTPAGVPTYCGRSRAGIRDTGTPRDTERLSFAQSWDDLPGFLFVIG